MFVSLGPLAASSDCLPMHSSGFVYRDTSSGQKRSLVIEVLNNSLA